MWVILFNFLWLNGHYIYFAMFHWFFSWWLGCIILLLCDFWSFHLSLLEHELWPVLCDLWDCSTFHFSVGLSLYMQMNTQPKFERNSFAKFETICVVPPSFIFCSANYSSPDTLDSVSSTERGCLGLFSNSFSLPVAWKLQGII